MGAARRPPRERRRAGGALRRSASRARSYLSPGVRRAPRAGTAGQTSGADAGDDGPLDADAPAHAWADDSSVRLCGDGAARPARAELPRVRRAAARTGKRTTGHRPRHWAGAGPHAAWHDDRLRRQPYEHAWRVRGAGVRHRKLRSRARARDPVPAPAAPTDDGGSRRRPPRAGCNGERSHPWRDRPDRSRRRHGPRDRVHGRRDSHVRHGRADDRLQHVDRGRGAGGNDRARRRHLRLSRRPAACSARRGVGSGGGRLAHAADRPWRDVRS